ncbi:hypothetical protein ACFL04_00210 [Patescibacteria group bacterium]
MKSIILFVIILTTIVSPALADQSIYLLFGEWVDGRSSGVVWDYETDRFQSSPFLFLNGEAAEYLLLGKIKPSGITLSIGPVLGLINDDDGAHPYWGGEFRSNREFGSYKFFFRYAERHSEFTRLHRQFNVGSKKSWQTFSLGVIYQPMLVDDPLDHRLALAVSKKFKYFTLIGESRVSFDGGRVSANVDIEIPFPD